MLLVSVENLTDRATLHNNAEVTAMVAAGVHAFLYGHQPREADSERVGDGPPGTPAMNVSIP